MTSDEIIAALRRYHPPNEWGFFPELRIGTGYKRAWGDPWEQRIDLWVVNYFPSRKIERRAYEIKVSRGDFLRELKHPDKRVAAMALSNRFFFAAPEGIVWEGEVPSNCGLVEVSGGRVRMKRQAAWRKCPNPPWRFVASLARRVIRNGYR